MNNKARAILKKIYYRSMLYLRRIFIPHAYRFEVDFIENIRANTYSDISYKESKLRSITHQLDKTLTLAKFKEMNSVVNTIERLSNDIIIDPDHDPVLITWCNNIVAQYNNRAVGQPENDVENYHFDSHAFELLNRVIETRRSIRSFKPEKISKEILSKILGSGLWAPSGCNRQTIEYLLIEDKDEIQYCQKIAGEGYSFPREASCAVVILADPRNYALPSQRHMAYLEGGAAIQNILLTANSLGVGSCWLFWSGGKTSHRDFIQKFKLNPWLLPVSMVCLGYPAIKPRYCPVRKTLNYAVHGSSVLKGTRPQKTM